jgi:hypothetical protein
MLTHLHLCRECRLSEVYLVQLRCTDLGQYSMYMPANAILVTQLPHEPPTVNEPCWRISRLELPT